MPPLRVNEQVLDSQKLIVGDYEVLLRHFPSFAVLRPRALAVDSFRVWGGRRLADSNTGVCDLKSRDSELPGQLTFFLYLALDIRVVDDFAQGDAAEQWTQETFSPAAAVGAVEDSHAEVTGKVGPLSKH